MPLISCRQCTRTEGVRVLRRTRRAVRYWCQRCGAVVREAPPVGVVGAVGAVGAVAAAPAIPEVPDLTPVMPAAMLGWLAGQARVPTRAQLDKATMYGLYARYDRAVGSPLPAFSRVVGLLNRWCYDVARVAAELSPLSPAARERIGHAACWLATDARELAWIVGRAPHDTTPAAARALLAGLDGAWTAERSRVLFAALFGVEGGPPPKDILALHTADGVRAALIRFAEQGERPLRAAVLAALDAAARP